MNVALPGATGFIGSHILAELQKHGHEVTALVRDDAQAEIVAGHGATPKVVDLYDRAAIVSLLQSADGAVHTASPGEATSADLDSAVVDAVIDAFAGTGKAYIHISGVWVYGNDTSISEQSPFNAPALGVLEGSHRTPGARSNRYARGRDRVQPCLRRRRRRDSRSSLRLR